MIYYKELVYIIMEAEKSHDLTSPSLRLKNAGGVPVPVCGPENEEC